jgi:hypothetical protein
MARCSRDAWAARIAGRSVSSALTTEVDAESPGEALRYIKHEQAAGCTGEAIRKTDRSLAYLSGEDCRARLG